MAGVGHSEEPWEHSGSEITTYRGKQRKMRANPPIQIWLSSRRRSWLRLLSREKRWLRCRLRTA